MLNSSYLKQEQVRIREQGLGSDILFMAASGAQQHIAGAAGNAQAVMGYPPAAAPPNAQAAVPHRREQTNEYAALFVALIGEVLPRSLTGPHIPLIHVDDALTNSSLYCPECGTLLIQSLSFCNGVVAPPLPLPGDICASSSIIARCKCSGSFR
jgi:hypothetical protein